MGVNAQASQVGTGRGASGPVTMWIVVAIAVASLVIAGIAIALRSDTATPIKQEVPSVARVVPPVSQQGPSVGGRDDPVNGSVGGYILENGVCHQCL